MGRVVLKLKALVCGCFTTLLLIAAVQLWFGERLSAALSTADPRRLFREVDNHDYGLYPSADVMPGGIPKIIHQTWSDNEVPAKFADNIKSWVRLHPDWQYRCPAVL